jgi:lipoprotein
MKKIILIVFSLMILFSSCCKEEFEQAPSVTYKVGIFHDATLNKKNISLEFQSTSGIIEKIIFESIWTFEVNGTPIYLEFHENDFKWQYQGRTIKGICKTSLGELLTNPNIIHKKTMIKGHVKIEGKWFKI